jgi:hypothetical protein
MKKLFGVSLAFLVVCFAFSSPAAAQRLGNGAGAFGATGQIVITGALEGHLHNGWELHLQPSADYFIATNVSVGATIGFTHDSGNPAFNAFNLGVRAGYNLAISDPVTFWPMVGINVDKVFGTGGNTATQLTIFAPFLFHLVPHLFVGAGPDFELALSGGGGNGYGLQTVVGGWF